MEITCNTTSADIRVFHNPTREEQIQAQVGRCVMLETIYHGANGNDNVGKLRSVRIYGMNDGALVYEDEVIMRGWPCSPDFALHTLTTHIARSAQETIGLLEAL